MSISTTSMIGEKAARGAAQSRFSTEVDAEDNLPIARMTHDSANEALSYSKLLQQQVLARAALSCHEREVLI